MRKNIAKSSVMVYDPGLLFPVLFLVGMGIVMTYSSSSAIALKKFGNDYFFLQKQFVFAITGICALIACRHIPYRSFSTSAYGLILLAILLVAATLVPGIGHDAGGASRWLRFYGISFQPTELAKFAVVVYLAYSMSCKRDKIKQFSIGFLPHAILLTAFAILIFLQPDFGSIVIIFAIAWIMMFIGGVRILHLASSLILIVPIACLLMIHEEYRLQRLISFMNPWRYSSDEGYQIVHSLMAFGSGGLSGTGIGQGYQKLFYLPEPHTDFIFSVIGEELGLVGVFVILVLYFIILWRGITIAKNAPDLFGSFLAVGLTTAIVLQACVNMGVTLGLLPAKGLTLPFLSYGGSSLLINMIFIGILMNIGASRKT